MRFPFAATLVVSLAAAYGQTAVDLRTQAKSVDFSAADYSRPFKAVAALPGTCSPGDSVWLSTAPTGSNVYVCVVANTWALQTGGGQANTASNVGSTGIGLFQQKSGVDLRFKKLAPASSRVLLVDDTVNSTVTVDVQQSSLSLGSLGGSLAASQIGASSKQGNGSRLAMFAGSGPTSGNCVQWDAGGNVSDAGAPCGTGSGSLPAQGGQAGKYLTTNGTTASWDSITRLQGVPVASVAPTSGQALVYNSSLGRWEPGSAGGGGGGSVLAGSGITVAGGTTVAIDTAVVPTYLNGLLTGYDFPSIPANSCLTAAFALTGASVLDAIVPGWPANLEQGLTGIMYVSTPGEVTVRLCNVSTSAVNPAPNNFRAMILRTF